MSYYTNFDHTKKREPFVDNCFWASININGPSLKSILSRPIIHTVFCEMYKNTVAKIQGSMLRSKLPQPDRSLLDFGINPFRRCSTSSVVELLSLRLCAFILRRSYNFADYKVQVLRRFTFSQDRVCYVWPVNISFLATFFTLTLSDRLSLTFSHTLMCINVRQSLTM